MTGTLKGTEDGSLECCEVPSAESNGLRNRDVEGRHWQDQRYSPRRTVFDVQLVRQ